MQRIMFLGVQGLGFRIIGLWVMSHLNRCTHGLRLHQGRFVTLLEKPLESQQKAVAMDKRTTQKVYHVHPYAATGCHVSVRARRHMYSHRCQQHQEMRINHNGGHLKVQSLVRICEKNTRLRHTAE